MQALGNLESSAPYICCLRNGWLDALFTQTPGTGIRFVWKEQNSYVLSGSTRKAGDDVETLTSASLGRVKSGLSCTKSSIPHHLLTKLYFI
jgi:hypothetical protein